MLGCPRLYYRKATAVLCGLCFLALLLFGPGTPSSNSLARKAIHASRISKLQNGCQEIHGSEGGHTKASGDSLRISEIVDNVFVNRQHGLLYCSVAKVGCSFWKRVFKVLDAASSGNLHVFDIKGTEVHFSIPDSMTLKNTTPEAFKSMLETYMKFIFVRDPFERLFSAYVDKILIPTILQTRVVNFFMDQKLVAKENLPCNRKISFGNFGSLLADAIMQKNYFEWHFSTISSQCHPCQFNFTMVGKMETFMADVREVFHRAHIDMSEVVGDVEDIDASNDVASIRDVIERVWRYYSSR